jgi:outer membrane autotransporter protein
VGAVLGGEGESFNLTSTGGKLSGTGISITPYGAYVINDWSSVDLEASYAFLDNDVTVVEGQPVTNHYISNRVFVAGNASAFWNVDAFTLRAKFGLLWANSSGPTYVDGAGVRAKPPNTTLEQVKLGGEIIYRYEQFEPFVDLTAAQDLKGTGTLTGTFITPTSSGARFGLMYDAGVRYKLEGGAQLGLQVGGETFRSHQSTFMAGVFARIPL